jgi:hypothetical protein
VWDLTTLLCCAEDDDVPDVADDLLDLLVAVVLTPALVDLLLLAELRAVLGDIFLVLLPALVDLTENHGVLSLHNRLLRQQSWRWANFCYYTHESSPGFRVADDFSSEPLL